MAQHDVDADLNKFYKGHVVLGTERRKLLAERRDACLGRLREGLKLLGEKHATTYKSHQRPINQGSYAMHTLNQHPEGEYDIDVAVIFAEADLPANAKDSRQRMANALLEAGGGFLTEPEARTNAVTVWYADGTHVDLAIYREVSGFWGTKLEHAGGDTWAERDPSAITDWFTRQVDERSPGLLANVRDQQLRRVVRWVKAFARSRVSWSLPGGMILTSLAVEVYSFDRGRDDVSLLNTVKALKYRLSSNLEVNNPVNGVSLTAKPECKIQVRNLLRKLEKATEWLSIIEESTCTREQTLRAWGRFFNHEFWGLVAEAEGPAEEVAKADVTHLRIDVGVARSQGGTTTPYNIKQGSIAKKRHIHFALPSEWRNVPNVEYRWTVRNTGDEAVEAKQEQYILNSPNEAWRTAAYQGIHTMTCEILRGGHVTARGVRRIRVGRW